MSTRVVFADTKVEYLLPSAAGASTGDVIAVTSAVGGLTLGFQAGGSGGLTAEDVYGEGQPYQLPQIAGAPQVGKVFTVIGGECGLASADPVEQATLYGAGQPYELPGLAAAAPGQIMQKVGTSLTFQNAPPPGLTQAQLYGTGNPYTLPEIEGVADGFIWTIAGGQTTFSEYTGLRANQLWAGAPNYILPNISGVAPGSQLRSNGAGAIGFGLNPSCVLPYTLYGGTSLTDPNAPYALGPIAGAADNQALTKQGGEAVWAAQVPGVQAAELWVNTAAQAKIPDYTGAAPNTMFAVSSVATGATAWNAPPESITYGALWADPQGVPTANYKLPVLGTQNQVLTVNDAGGLGFEDASTLGTTTVTAAFTSQFGGTTTPQTVLFSKTGKTVVCTITSCDPITVQDAANVKAWTMVPDDLTAIATYLPIDNTPHNYDLGTLLCSADDELTVIPCMMRINTQTGAITVTSNGETFAPEGLYLPGPIVASSAFLGTWITA